MGWSIGVALLLTLRPMVQVASLPLTPNEFHDIDGFSQNIDSFGFDDKDNYINQSEDYKLEQISKLLADILVQPWPKGISPILYVEEYPTEDTLQEPDQMYEDNDLNNMPFKRSKYYRKYPWKRQNSRYDAENRYLCQPSKEDVFRLLVALHEARQGNRGQTVNFCNRKRPTSAIFTNIRFLG